MVRQSIKINQLKLKIKDNGFYKSNRDIKESPAFTQLTDLAEERLGGKVLYATDDFC